MADVGLGQLATATGRARRKARVDAVRNDHPVMEVAEKFGGIVYEEGGRTIVDPTLSGQNATTQWVGESGKVTMQDQRVLDAPEFDWKYMLTVVMWTLAERYKNMGPEKKVDIVSSKMEAAEASALNEFHEGLVSNGTGNGGLQLMGLAGLVPTTPSTGSRGGIDLSLANSAWYRTQKFDTANDWSDGAVDATNAKRFLNKALIKTRRKGKSMIDVFLAGETHFEFFTQAIEGIQVIQNENDSGKAGYDKIYYRGKPIVCGSGINFSGATEVAATRTYGLCMKPGGLNVVFHRKAEFEFLEEINSSDQAAISRLLFVMAATTMGGLAKFNWVGFD